MAMERDRDQVFAEAFQMWGEGQSWWIDEDELYIVTHEQGGRIDSDIWENRISDWLETKFASFTLSEVLGDALAVPIERQGHKEKLRISGILTKLGCIGGERETIGGKQQRVYRRAE
jgi:predicted P-loop ATPase